LLEREREFGELRAALGAVAAGEGQAVVVVGAAGMGKSSLLAATVAHARDRGLMVRRARGFELEQDLSFGVIRQLFEPLVRSAEAPARERLLAGAAGAAARLFDHTPADRSVPGEGGFATLHGIYWLIAAIAAEQPLVLAIDDLHWGDLPSLRTLSYVAGRIAELPVALVLTLRPGEPTAGADLIDALQADPHVRRLALAPLSPDASTQLVQAAIPAPTPELCRAFGRASAGNPFYLRELLRTIAPPNHPPPSVADVNRAALATIGERIHRRLTALGPSAPTLLHDAAEIAGLDSHTAAITARAMRRVEILATEDPYEWIHPLVRRSIYDHIALTERDTLHTRAAEILTAAGVHPERIATHLKALRPAGSTDVVAGLLSAADQALARDAPEVAIDLLQRALREQAPHPPKPTLLLRLGQIELTRRNPGAAPILREAHELSRDPRERAAAALALAEILTMDGRAQESADVILAAIEEFDGADPGLALELEVARAVVFAFDPALADGFWRGRERLVSLTDRQHWSARALSALLALTSAYRGEHLDEVLPMCDRALAGGALIAERGAGAWASSHVLGAMTAVEAHDRAAQFADSLELAARSQGSVANALIADGHRGWGAARRGDLARTEEILRPLVETTRTHGMFLYFVTALWWMLDAILERTALDDLAVEAASLELPPAVMEVAIGAWPLLARGRVRALQGLPDLAEQDLRAAGRVLDGIGFGPLHDPWRVHLALVLPSDRREEARALVDEELAMARATGFARPTGIALRAAGLLTGGDEGIEVLGQSVRLLADSPARYEYARSLVELGGALRRAGRRTDSRQHLQAGMDLAHHCGAERLLIRAREELLATGARPRRLILTGFDSLTASERRVVRLAAEGHSNPEIAQALFVSLKTVETHLSHAYAKIGLAGPGARRKLPQLVAQSG
jgi:tetratricopeptide (TPR) repeat protein